MTQQQKGYLYQSHGAWYVRYRQQVYEPDGSIASVQRSKRLASTREFPKKSEVVQLRNEFMAKLNRVGFTPEAGVSLVEFVENVISRGLQRGWLRVRLEAIARRGAAISGNASTVSAHATFERLTAKP